jgi:hypothetical protein
VAKRTVRENVAAPANEHCNSTNTTGVDLDKLPVGQSLKFKQSNSYTLKKVSCGSLKVVDGPNPRRVGKIVIIEEVRHMDFVLA